MKVQGQVTMYLTRIASAPFWQFRYWHAIAMQFTITI